MKTTAHYSTKHDALIIETGGEPETLRRHEVPACLNRLWQRAYEAERQGGQGAVVELTDSEMIL